METPSGLHSVVSTVPGGLETPDFLELRKNASRPEATDSGPKQLYHVVQEKQTTIRGVMGSERGYDVSGLTGQVPVLGDERGTKVSSGASCHGHILNGTCFFRSAKPTELTYPLMHQNWKVYRMPNCGLDTTQSLVARPAFPVEHLEKISPSWSPKKCARERRSVNEWIRTGARRKTSSSDLAAWCRGGCDPVFWYSVPHIYHILYARRSIINVLRAIHARFSSEFRGAESTLYVSEGKG